MMLANAASFANRLHLDKKKFRRIVLICAWGWGSLSSHLAGAAPLHAGAAAVSLPHSGSTLAQAGSLALNLAAFDLALSTALSPSVLERASGVALSSAEFEQRDEHLRDQANGAVSSRAAEERLASSEAQAGASGSQSPSPDKELALPEERASLETVERALQGVGLVGDQLVMFTKDRSQAIITRFDSSGMTREASFGALTAQTRRNLPQEFGPNWRSVLDGGRVLMLLDGRNLALTGVDPERWSVVLRRSIPWDELKPAADRGGEATRQETAAMRADFRKNYIATAGLKIAGMAAIPSAWVGGKGRHFLAATRIARYPLLLVSCYDESSACEVSRACRLHGASELSPSSVAGIGVSAARRLVVIADRERRRLLGFRFDSCYHLPRQGSWTLPVAKLPGSGGADVDASRLQLGNMTIDGEDRLWVATEHPDHFLSASLYMWRADQW